MIVKFEGTLLKAGDYVPFEADRNIDQVPRQGDLIESDGFPSDFPAGLYRVARVIWRINNGRLNPIVKLERP